jgi:hypothetical protein
VKIEKLQMLSDEKAKVDTTYHSVLMIVKELNAVIKTLNEIIESINNE